MALFKNIFKTDKTKSYDEKLMGVSFYNNTIKSNKLIIYNLDENLISDISVQLHFNDGTSEKIKITNLKAYSTRILNFDNDIITKGKSIIDIEMINISINGRNNCFLIDANKNIFPEYKRVLL